MIEGGELPVIVGSLATAVDLQREAWQWAQAKRADNGSLPSRKQIAERYGRHERWGRLVKNAGFAGELDAEDVAVTGPAAAAGTGPNGPALGIQPNRSRPIT